MGSGKGRSRATCPLRGCQNMGLGGGGSCKAPRHPPCAPCHVHPWLRGGGQAGARPPAPSRPSGMPWPWLLPPRWRGGFARSLVPLEGELTPSRPRRSRRMRVYGAAHPSTPHTGTRLPLRRENAGSGCKRSQGKAGSHPRPGAGWGEPPHTHILCQARPGTGHPRAAVGSPTALAAHTEHCRRGRSPP